MLEPAGEAIHAYLFESPPNFLFGKNLFWLLSGYQLQAAEAISSANRLH